ncbi:hypothetical protein Ae201684_004859 [Aphanomyces euteiches]|uniref:Uncharacterized protein n=1 Tax=Aphanomyces euteiches TaxID=100861 RepID=A0A6G0XHX7_9STRA|nr:hypothetical protein Ae201684_004859 [Aphanomyces euteiches]
MDEEDAAKINVTFTLQESTDSLRAKPPQRYSPRLLNTLFAIIGIGYLFPFSALTQPVDYWHVLFPTLNMEFYITCVFQYTNLIALGLVVSFGSTESLSYTRRIVGGFTGQLVVLVFVPLASYIFSNETPLAATILSATAFVAVATAFLDSCVIGLAATYPVHAQEALQFGVGLSSFIGSLYRDLTKLVFPENAVKTSSAVYFYTGAFTICICIAAYFVLLRLPVPSTQSHEGYEPASSGLTGASRWTIMRKCLKSLLTVTFLFMTTLCVWPPLVTEIQSFNFPDLQASGWWPLILLTVFSVIDCIGRLLVPYRLGLTKDNLWKPVVARVLLVPCLVMSVRGIWFTHDAWSVVFVALLGLTNGYLGSLSVVFVTENVDVDEERAIAGSFTGFFLSAGLVIGSTVGLGFSKWVVPSVEMEDAIVVVVNGIGMPILVRTYGQAQMPPTSAVGVVSAIFHAALHSNDNQYVVESIETAEFRVSYRQCPTDSILIAFFHSKLLIPAAHAKQILRWLDRFVHLVVRPSILASNDVSVQKFELSKHISLLDGIMTRRRDLQLTIDVPLITWPTSSVPFHPSSVGISFPTDMFIAADSVLLAEYFSLESSSKPLDNWQVVLLTVAAELILETPGREFMTFPVYIHQELHHVTVVQLSSADHVVWFAVAKEVIVPTSIASNIHRWYQAASCVLSRPWAMPHDALPSETGLLCFCIMRLDPSPLCRAVVGLQTPMHLENLFPKDASHLPKTQRQLYAFLSDCMIQTSSRGQSPLNRIVSTADLSVVHAVRAPLWLVFVVAEASLSMSKAMRIADDLACEFGSSG